MQLPLRIFYRYMESSRGVEARLREEANKPERHDENSMACRIIVEAPHARHHPGKRYGNGCEPYIDRLLECDSEKPATGFKTRFVRPRGVQQSRASMVHIQK